MQISCEDAVPEVLVLLSGGADSAACLHFFKEMDRPTSALFIDYQQSALKEEADSAQRIASHYGVALSVARFVGVQGKGPGLIGGRNAFLLSAALMELPRTISAVAIGVHAGTAYSDCTKLFIDRMQAVYDTSSARNIKIVAPFIEWAKADIWTYARSADVPLSSTYSCERGGDPPCMSCESCGDRRALEGYAASPIHAPLRPKHLSAFASSLFHEQGVRIFS